MRLLCSRCSHSEVPEARISGTGHHRVVQDLRSELGERVALKTESGDVRRGDKLVDEAQCCKDGLAERAQAKAQNQQEDLQENIINVDDTDAGTKKGRLQSKVAGMRVRLTNLRLHSDRR